MLARLAGEAAIGIHVDRPAGHAFDDGDGEARLHMRRVAADAHLTAFERHVLDDIFGDARELTTESHRRRHAGTDYDPDAAIARRLAAVGAVTSSVGGPVRPAGRRWSPARIGLGLVLAIALVGVFMNVGPVFDVVPIVGLWAFFTVALVNAWPADWWYPGRAVRGLLVALVLLYGMQLTMLFMPNRPLPAEAWAASAIAAVAAYLLILARSPRPRGHDGAVTDLLRMRAYAQAELQRPRPQLDDRWIPRLRALGLGPAIDAWRARHAGAGAMPPEVGDRPRITSAHFTGVGPAPWSGPKGWQAALRVYDDAEYGDDEDDHADADADADADAAAEADPERPPRR
jgi:hypothetical protein